MSYIIFCKQQDQGRPLPKFGEWDVNNPASAEGFTVIFSKARDEKKSGAAAGAGAGAASQRKTNSSQANSQYPPPVVQFDHRAMKVLLSLHFRLIVGNECLLFPFSPLLPHAHLCTYFRRKH
ncbi:hypothetical protein H0E87_000931 [Populus deltoides]|uniref:RIN4 pathogenic type III effector avirulence factor Avr cleavage site domain-containing protein n=1 Tax=Populus deltoides TaxID=3696 RepID=A0A8T2ZPF7_POPDE|nr:hypothetical protein H0E87_000931 [Populus deltoides]